MKYRRAMALSAERVIRRSPGPETKRLVLSPDPRGSSGTSPAPSEAMVQPHLLTPGEVADLLRTSRKAVYSMAERALIPGVVRIGRRLLFRRADLLGWLQEKRAPSPGRTRR